MGVRESRWEERREEKLNVCKIKGKMLILKRR